MSEKSKAFVIFSVSRLGPVPGPLGLLRRNVNTVKPDNSSTRLSPPKASSAKLPATRPDQTEPITSMVIHAELKYSTLMPLPILICLQDRWVLLQQQEAQSEQSVGVRHVAQEFSAQPQVWQDDDVAQPSDKDLLHSVPLSR